MIAPEVIGRLQVLEFGKSVDEQQFTVMSVGEVVADGDGRSRLMDQQLPIPVECMHLRLRWNFQELDLQDVPYDRVYRNYFRAVQEQQKPRDQESKQDQAVGELTGKKMLVGKYGGT